MYCYWKHLYLVTRHTPILFSHCLFTHSFLMACESLPAHDTYVPFSTLPIRQTSLSEQSVTQLLSYDDLHWRKESRITFALPPQRRKAIPPKTQSQIRVEKLPEDHEVQIPQQTHSPALSTTSIPQAYTLQSSTLSSMQCEGASTDEPSTLPARPDQENATSTTFKTYRRDNQNIPGSGGLLSPISFSRLLDQGPATSSRCTRLATKKPSSSASLSNYIFYPPRNPCDNFKPFIRPGDTAPRRQLSYGEPCTPEPRRLHKASRSRELRREACLKWETAVPYVEENKGPHTSSYRPYYSEPARTKPRLYLDLLDETSKIEEAVSSVTRIIALFQDPDGALSMQRPFIQAQQGPN